ncbi:uncharacterized protein N7443_009481 [Penicillium atrosanguineum]|uniref:uncharacterized protein n=1 Tax=Penicillium atrosanguineum TaxID=1132637 RepID=UPI00239EA628|nr:uncharacterized protein N7443_009481 [Penicillium atrosanguineum]KAJ5293528.1 hypothetical protein N7443_009481 [Penicillium atrosanguineum]
MDRNCLSAEACDEKGKAPTTHLITLLDQVAYRFPDHDAIISHHQTDTLNATRPLHWSFAQLQQMSIQLAARLSSKGVGHGSRIVTLMFNQAQWALLFCASARLGCQFVPLDPRVLDRDDHDILSLLNQLEPAAMFVSTEAMSNRIDQIKFCQKHRSLVQCVVADEETTMSAGWTTLTKIMSEPLNGTPILPGPGKPDDTALILFTSGTTALPKGCPHTSISIGAQALGLMDHLDVGPGANLCQHLPNFHVFNVTLTLAFWLAGATVSFPSPSFNTQSSVQLIRSYPGVSVPCVPAMVHALSNCVSPEHSSRLSFQMFLGGAPVTLDVVKRSRDLGATRVVVGYGMTEGIAILNTSIDTTSLDLINRDISVGKIFSGGRVRICALGSRTPIHKEEIGEVHLGGLPVFGGYIGSSSVSCYRENGVSWIATGDQGYMDGDGYLYLLGRYKDLIIRGGENISPLKIERCLGEVSEITEACVIGIPDATAGEVPVAVIRKDPSTQAPKQKTIQMMILNKLGASFAPARVLDLLEDLRKDTYPTTTSGKIQKAMLREWVIDHLNQVAVENPVSFNDLTSELTKFWSAITGLAVGDIDPDVSIRTFADSMMQIQFCHLIGQKLQLVIRQSDLIKFNTIQQQAKLLKERMQLHAKDSRCHDSAHGHPIQLDMERAKLVASSKLDPLGFGWDDIQEVIPISDCLKRSHCGFRPNSWNIRVSWILNSSITIADVQAAFHTWLQRHPLLRCTPVTYDDELDLYLAMHPSADWMRLQVINGGTVEDVKCVATYKLNDPEYDYIDTNGPLFRATTLSVNNPSVVGLVMHLHHLMFDAHILSRWFEDLRDLLNHKEELLNFHPYRDYITDYHSHRTGATSQKAVDFHVDRIRGVSSATDALWPPQIAPHWLKGDNQGWVHSDNTPGCSSERPLLDGDKSCGTKGISRAVLVPKILELQYKFAITPPIIAKCACALLNVRMTGAKEAIFGVIESGRTWPSADESQPDDKEMEILEVDGPTITHILNRTRITPEETAIQLLARMTKDQDNVVSHIYAPINEICRKLDDSDEKSFIDIVHRQSFNWIMGGYKEHASDPIKRIEAIARPDLGLSWLPALLEGNMLRLTVSYDDAQLRASEVHNIMTEFLCAVAWLSDPANMDKNVAQCEFQGQDIVDLDREGPGRYHK